MKKNFLKKLVTGILAATLGVTALAGCGSAKTADKGDKVYRTLDEIKDSGEINIGVFSDKNPFGYVDDNGDYQGYDVYFADRIGKEVEIQVKQNETGQPSEDVYPDLRQLIQFEIEEDDF